jgi:rSAM/selenodomain-associated transferase 1
VTTKVVVFGRLPEQGRVKTRLASVVGVEAAARVYRAVLEHTLREAVATGLPATLALAEPPPKEMEWGPPAGVAVQVQAAGDLGTRMARAFAAQFSSGADAVVLVGSDIPLLTGAVLLEAASACARVAVVLGPTLDGGYYLVGQAAPGLDIFTGVPWSSSETLASTRARLAAHAVPHEELSALRDLDTREDLDATLGDPTLDPRLRLEIEAAVGEGGTGTGRV